MKKLYTSVVIPLTNLSGIPWTPGSGVQLSGSSQTEKNIWNDYVKVRGNRFSLSPSADDSQAHPQAKDFKGGYQLYDDLFALIPGHAKGIAAFHGRLLAQQPQRNDAPSDAGAGSGTGTTAAVA